MSFLFHLNLGNCYLHSTVFPSRSRRPRPPASSPSPSSRTRSAQRNHHSSTGGSGRKSSPSASSNSLPFLAPSHVPSRRRQQQQQQEYDGFQDFGFYEKYYHKSPPLLKLQCQCRLFSPSLFRPSTRTRLRTTTASPWGPTTPRPSRRRPTPTPTSSTAEDMTFRTSPFQGSTPSLPSTILNRIRQGGLTFKGIRGGSACTGTRWQKGYDLGTGS